MTRRLIPTEDPNGSVITEDTITGLGLPGRQARPTLVQNVRVPRVLVL